MKPISTIDAYKNGILVETVFSIFTAAEMFNTGRADNFKMTTIIWDKEGNATVTKEEFSF